MLSVLKAAYGTPHPSFPPPNLCWHWPSCRHALIPLGGPLAYLSGLPDVMRSILASYSRLALMSDKVFYNTSGITLIFFFAERAIPAGLAAELAAGEPRVDWRQPRGPERCQQTPAASTLKLLLKAEQGGHFLRRWWVLPQTGWPPRTTREQRRPQGTPVTFMPVAMPWGSAPPWLRRRWSKRCRWRSSRSTCG